MKNIWKDRQSLIKANTIPNIKKRVDDYCKDEGISKADFIRRALDMLENQ